MRVLAQSVSGKKISTPDSPENGRENGSFCHLSVLCMYEDPLYMDGIRRNLERDSDIFVEVSVSVEDALHLMNYLLFDVVVTDCITWQGEQNGFLKAMREQGMEIPVIYFIRGLKTGSIKDARRYGRVRYLIWGEQDPSPPFNELAGCIHEMVAPGPGEVSRNAFGWPRRMNERMV